MLFAIVLSFLIGTILSILTFILQKNKQKVLKLRSAIITVIWWWYFSFVFCSILWLRDAQPVTTINLVPFVELVHTFFFLDKKEALLALLNFALFIPMGSLLALQLQSSKFYNWIPVFGFMSSVFIEVAQYLFKLGIADINDIILNSLGTAWGWSLHKWLFLKRRRAILFSLLPVLACTAILVHQAVQPYGKTDHDMFLDTVSINKIAYDESFKDTPLPATANVYMLSNNKNDSENTIISIFEALDATIAEKIPYDNCYVCYSEKRTFCLWYYNREQHFKLTNFKHDFSNKLDPTSLSSIYNFFSLIGISLPDGLEYAVDNNDITINASFLPYQDNLYDGCVSFHMIGDRLDTLEFELTKLTHHSSVDLISLKQVQDTIAQGKFYYSEANSINQMICHSIELVYILDSRGCYRPYYKIYATIDDWETAIMIDAIEK